MTIPILLIGATIAMCIFAALGWSVVRAVQTTGRLRALHLANGALIIAAMACLSLDLATLSRILGALLLAIGLACALVDGRTGAARLFPLLGAVFGFNLMLGLPFA